MVPTFTLEPLDGVGAQLCPCSIATTTPQAFTVASRSATSTDRRSSPHIFVRVRAATRPRSTRFEPVALLRGVQSLVPHVHLSVLLAGPGPSGGADPSRRCRGCFRPPRRLPGSGCPQLHQLAATGRWRRSFTSSRFKSASWRSMSMTQRRSGSAGSKARLTRSSEGSASRSRLVQPPRRRRWMPEMSGLAHQALDPFARAAHVEAELELGVDPRGAIGAPAHGPDVDDGVAQVGVVEVLGAHRVGPPGIEARGRHPHHPTAGRRRAGPCRPGR